MSANTRAIRRSLLLRAFEWSCYLEEPECFTRQIRLAHPNSRISLKSHPDCCAAAAAVALALAIFALWDPVRCIFAAFLFGAFFTLQYRLQEFFSPELLALMPYVFTVVALIVVAFSKGRRAFGAPEALGIPYQRGER